MGKGKRASIDSSYMVRLLFRKGYEVKSRLRATLKQFAPGTG